ncbi:unnamed protein product [Paramecium primaurelia]|uniref:Uncharacterized protein n=1 Tax=Paramecium primaurelia TaxID=5886 RepID=A0A8S1NCS2_PARPR|nr:unnamed protein product [Paramecium primaurelia]
MVKIWQNKYIDKIAISIKIKIITASEIQNKKQMVKRHYLSYNSNNLQINSSKKMKMIKITCFQHFRSFINTHIKLKKIERKRRVRK